jgi:hypothetical protein
VSKNGGFDDQYDFLRLFFSPLQQDLSEWVRRGGCLCSSKLILMDNLSVVLYCLYAGWSWVKEILW